MNIHHLELFYYVAQHGGISRAVRHIPYGIQQPAVSSQMLLLEEDLGTRLFERSPFRLTEEGRKLFAFVRPFFENLDAVAARLRKQAVPLLRIGTSELVLREYLPPIMQLLHQKHPQVRLSLQSGFTFQLDAWLQDRQIDLAITPLEKRPPARVRCLRLMRVPLVLLVHRKAKYKSAAELWAPGPDRGAVDHAAGRGNHHPPFPKRACSATGSNGRRPSRRVRWSSSPNTSPTAMASASA